ncbi:TonB-dependent receptor [Halioglobus maricola]|uniref:TonB-dependent receptor n=1 Tax=Halioglobus maricola TaxID=2601894 RepID=A0A5P9NKD7_9GAMM|nr:TonB-dependent receptor [Halioglobus maricola]QFU75946.1 TonB-dependent receptor [Halioglobus maricola]
MYKSMAAALSAATLWSSALSAQTMEELLVTGSYVPQEELTASVSVLDSNVIEAQDIRDVVDVLRLAPGLVVEEQGGPGGLTAVSIRGGDANFTLVLIDGVPVNDPTNTRGGSFDFGRLDPAMVERIEIVRGAQSAIYGSDALSGVINIITRSSSAEPRSSVGVSLGEDDFARYHASFSGDSGALQYSLQLVHRDDGEPVEGSTRTGDQADLRMRWQASSEHELSFAYRYADGDNTSYPEQSGGPEFALTDDLDQGEYRDDTFSLGWNAQFSEAWASTLTASRVDQEAKAFSPGIPPYAEVPPNGSDTEYRRDELRWVNELAVGAATDVALGASYRDETGDSDGYVDFFGLIVPTDFSLDREIKGVFAGVSSAPLDPLLIQASIRYDDPDGFDSETSAGAGVRWQFSSGLALRANWSEAYKLPSFFALGHALVGNPELEPEEAETWDIGLNWFSGDKVTLEATLFKNEYTNLVDFDEETFRNINRGRVDSEGVELYGQWQAGDALRFDGQLTFTDMDVPGEDVELPSRPEWQGAAAAYWDISATLTSALQYRYTGEQLSVSRHTGQAQQSELDAYHLVDLTFTWLPADRWRIALSADNLLDENYQTSVGFPGQERNFRLGLSYTLD